MKRFIYLLFFSYGACAFGQSTSTSQKEATSKIQVEQVAVNEKNATVSIKATFPVAVYEAYQTQAQQKIQDFYAYLNALAQAQDENEQEEIKKTILLDFALPQIKVQDLTTTSNQSILLLDLLNKIKQTHTTFTCTNFSEEGVGETYFIIGYDLTTQNGTPVKTTRIKQKVQFMPKTKSFGTTQKTIWELKLLAF